MTTTTNFEKVKLWMKIARQNVREEPTLDIPQEEKVLRRRLIREEFDEWLDATHAGGEGDLCLIADALADLLYVIYGTAVTYGINLDEIFDIVHENNLTKFENCKVCQGSGRIYNVEGMFTDKAGRKFTDCLSCDGTGKVPILREDGKVLKSPAWHPPTAEIRTALGL